MFAAIRGQLEPPPSILRVIHDLEATGCPGQALASGPSLRVQLGGGWDSNVTQGISARSLVLGSGENVLELELDPSYRPRSSAFVQGSIDYSLSLPASATNFQFSMGHRKNASESRLDVTSVSAAASRDFSLPQGTLRTQLELSEVWLGGINYQHAQTAGLQWLRADAAGAWLATASAGATRYVTQPGQNSVQWDVGVLREHRIDASAAIHVGVSLQEDHATGLRPGGDRSGYQLQLGAVVLRQGWRIKPELTYNSWRSDEVFAPGLVDVRRHNRLTQFVLQGEKPLTAQTSLVLEWRTRRAQDPVVLYAYKAQVLSATLAYRF